MAERSDLRGGKKMKIKGFNSKEQKLFNVLKDGKSHNIRELKKLFWQDAKEQCAEVYEKGWGEHEIDGQAQSYVRNSVRRLVRDGWVDGPHMKKSLARGTYQLSSKGVMWVKSGLLITASFGSRKKKGKEKAPVKQKEKEAVARALKRISESTVE
jgi:hypothetical protein